MAPKFPNAAVDAKTAHQGRQVASAQGKVLRHPHGHYSHDSLMLGVVTAINGSPNPSVDIAPNGAQNLSSSATMTAVQFFPPYVPTIDDVVVVVTQPVGKSRSLRYVLGKVAGAASPYPIPLGGFDASNRFVYDLLNAWAATGVPSASLGANNDWCLSQNGHLYFKSGGTWTQKV